MLSMRIQQFCFQESTKYRRASPTVRSTPLSYRGVPWPSPPPWDLALSLPGRYPPPHPSKDFPWPSMPPSVSLRLSSLSCSFILFLSNYSLIMKTTLCLYSVPNKVCIVSFVINVLAFPTEKKVAGRLQIF